MHDLFDTDSNELVELTTKLNPSVKIVERKPELATDTVGKIEVIRDSFLQLEREDNIFDLIIDLDLTSPLREVSNLEELIDEHLKNLDKDVYFSVVSARRNPYLIW